MRATSDLPTSASSLASAVRKATWGRGRANYLINQGGGTTHQVGLGSLLQLLLSLLDEGSVWVGGGGGGGGVRGGEGGAMSAHLVRP